MQKKYAKYSLKTAIAHAAAHNGTNSPAINSGAANTQTRLLSPTGMVGTAFHAITRTDRLTPDQSPDA